MSPGPTGVFLEQVDAVVVAFDLRGFSSLAAHRSPVELGALLTRFYEHVEDIVEKTKGQIVRWQADIVLAAWLSSPRLTDYRAKALEAVRAAIDTQVPWADAGVADGMPALIYSVAAAAGTVLAGQLGTAKRRQFDVLGEPASVAARLAVVATQREVSHLVTADCCAGLPGPAVEAEPIELGGKGYRLYRVA